MVRIKADSVRKLGGVAVHGVKKVFAFWQGMVVFSHSQVFIVSQSGFHQGFPFVLYEGLLFRLGAPSGCMATSLSPGWSWGHAANVLHEIE
jgi:hypothetical protein